MEISAILKILIVFLGILTLSRVKLPLGLALIAGGGLMELWAGKTLAMVGADFTSAALQPEVWLLMLNIGLIIEIGHFMAAERNARAIIRAARRLGGAHGQVMSLVMIPAAIGLVPMPGGALFSAPLVGRSVADSTTSPEWRAAVNYWFRHILEYWWPLYPVVIVSLSIFTMETWQFMAVQMPFTLVSVGTGYLVLLRGRACQLVDNGADDRDGSSLFKVLLPILLIVAATLLLPGLIRPQLPAVSSTVCKLLAMLVGLVIALLVILCDQGRLGEKRLPFVYLFSWKTANILFVLAGVMIFQDLLDSSQLLPIAGRELAASRVPVAVIVAVLPFLAGLVTGIAIGFAGTAFPIIAGFLGLAGHGLSPLAALVLAFSMGYAGMMLSPVHLCLVLTREYFSASLFGVYRYLLPCVFGVILFGVGFYFVLAALGW